MNHSPDPNLLDRYLAGEATPAEIERTEARRKADPEWSETIDGLAPGRACTPRWSRCRSGADS